MTESFRTATSALRVAATFGAFFCASTVAMAEEADSSSRTAAHEPPRSAATEVTRVAYTHSAFGASERTLGAAGFGEGRGAFDRGGGEAILRCAIAGLHRY